MNYKDQNWFSGIRHTGHLVGFSLWNSGQRKYLKKIYGVEPVTTMLVPNNGKPIRKFCLDETKKLNEYSVNEITKDPKIILKYLRLEDENWKEIFNLCSLMKSSIQEKNTNEALILLKFLAQKIELHGAYFRIIFSLGMKMTELDIEKYELFLHEHDHWRNSLVFKEDKVEAVLKEFVGLFLPGINTDEILKYLTYDDLIQNINNPIIVSKIIDKRKQGYVFCSGEDFFGVRDDADFVAEAERFFSELETIELKNEFCGRVTYVADDVIIGEVVVVENYKILNDSYEGKILVAVQTTPHFVPYLKGVKAIITDEGGVTSHAAIISREFKIPAVVGTQIATKVLKTGDIVEITFKEGIVKKVSTKK